MNKKIIIKWKRLVDDNEKTCHRCNKTYENLEEALQVISPLLEKLNFQLIFEKVAIAHDEFKKNPLTSNQILIDNELIEHILSLKIGKSKCCGPCGDSECRTIVDGHKEIVEVPVKTILKAILKKVMSEL